MSGIKDYLPNGCPDKFALVLRRPGGGIDSRAYTPIGLFQIIGGKRWSVSLVRLGKDTLNRKPNT